MNTLSNQLRCFLERLNYIVTDQVDFEAYPWVTMLGDTPGLIQVSQPTGLTISTLTEEVGVGSRNEQA